MNFYPELYLLLYQVTKLTTYLQSSYENGSLDFNILRCFKIFGLWRITLVTYDLCSYKKTCQSYKLLCLLIKICELGTFFSFLVVRFILFGQWKHVGNNNLECINWFLNNFLKF